MSEEFDPADFSFVVKRRDGPLKPWVWEIYRAGRSVPVKRSAVFFETMAEADQRKKRPLLASWQNGLPDVEVVPWVALGEATAHNVPLRTLAKIDRASRYALYGCSRPRSAACRALNVPSIPYRSARSPHSSGPRPTYRAERYL